MPKLLIRSSDTGATRNLSIGEEVITIGRCDSNDLCLPHLSVSNSHARIIPENGRVVVKDLQSTNGTKVNGERIQQEHVLVHLDDITIGAYQLCYSETSLGGYRLSFSESTAPAQDSGSDTAKKHVTQLPPPVRNNWILIQKKFDYPVNAFGVKIEPDDVEAMKVWKREKIDENGRLS